MNGTWLDYYEILEVEFGCSFDEIKDKYRELLRKYHPDNPDGDEEKTILINEAYDVLSDDEKRRKYDETYMSIKNGEMDPNEEEVEDVEMPKYTHEEMYETFNEEEIRFAKKVALQQAISETLENAKIIIDAKNELLFAAFNDFYDELSYKEEYEEFSRLTKDFIDNLYNLIDEAKVYDLDNEINTINDVIDFLNKAINEIPKNLKDAKLIVKKELIKEQLKAEAEECISYGKFVKVSFSNFYIQVYDSVIGPEDFRLNYYSNKINMEDAISKLCAIYELLKMYELEEEFQEVGKLIGVLREDLVLYKEDYDFALKIGKRESVKKYIEETILKFEEYKQRMCEIVKIIVSNPTDKNISQLVDEGRKITAEFQSRLQNIKEKDLDIDLFKDGIKDIYKKASKLYNKSVKAHKKLDEAFQNKECSSIDDYTFEYIKDDIESINLKTEVLQMLKKLFTLYGSYEEYKNFSSSKDYKKKLKEINGYYDRSSALCKNLENIYEYILKTQNIDLENVDEEVFDETILSKLKEKLTLYKDKAEYFERLKHTISLIVPACFLTTLGYILLSDSFDHVVSVATFSAVGCLLSLLVGGFLGAKEDENMILYLEYLARYNSYALPSDPSYNNENIDLNSFYQKSLSI